MKKGHKMTPEQRKKISLSKMGEKNPNFCKPGTCLGRKQTEEQRRKIKLARSKQIITDEHKKKISEGLKLAYAIGIRKREDCHFYIDGRSPRNRIIKKSFKYRNWRTSVFKRDNYTCRHCLKRGGELQAHHIKPQSLFPELRFSIENGLTLCRPCHLKTDTWGLRISKKPGHSLKNMVK